jgi:Protein of unknown function (DUF3025)
VLPTSSLASALKAPAPWWSPYLGVAQRVLNAERSESVVAALNEARETATDTFCFVDHSILPVSENYESFIARTACVPTRENLHDLLNGLVWLRYPNIKRRLNALHAQQIAARGTTGVRGPLRDALTLLDENGALLQAPAILVDALHRRDWNALFVQQRAHWRSAHLVVLGHALMEKLMQPRKAITAHVWVVEDLDDKAVAATLSPERLAAKTFLPLPLLGVPGWWLANEDPGFYDDADVFRRPS